MSGVKFSKCSKMMILNYWKQKEHHGGAIFLLNIHLRAGSSKTSKHSTMACPARSIILLVCDHCGADS
jgi:hypothetical protein